MSIELLPKIGETVTKTIYIHYDEYSPDGMSISSVDMSQPYFDYPKPLLGSFEAKFVMPDADIKGQQVIMLKRKIDDLNASHHVAVKNIEDQIQRLLAIGHDGGVA